MKHIHNKCPYQFVPSTYAKDKMQFEERVQEVNEAIGKNYQVIAWRVNHEMLLLAVACSGVLYFKFIPAVVVWGVYEYFCVIIPVLSLYLVYTVVHSSYD